MDTSAMGYFGLLAMICLGIFLFFIAAGTLSVVMEVFGNSFRGSKRLSKLAVVVVTVALVSMAGCAYIS